MALLLKILQGNGKRINLRVLALSINAWMLAGAVLFLMAVLSDLLTAAYAEDQGKWEFMHAMITGPHWYQVVIPFIVYAILPQMMWFRKLRRNIIISLLIVLVWFGAFYTVRYITQLEGIKIPLPDLGIQALFSQYGMKIFIQAILISVTYLFIVKKEKSIG